MERESRREAKGCRRGEIRAAVDIGEFVELGEGGKTREKFESERDELDSAGGKKDVLIVLFLHSFVRNQLTFIQLLIRFF